MYKGRWRGPRRSSGVELAGNVRHEVLLIEKTSDRPIRPATPAILGSNLLDNGAGPVQARRAPRRALNSSRPSQQR
jgi:hypothetical protein